MQARTKSALFLFGALLVGGLIGALLTSAVINNRVEELQALRMRGGPGLFLERIIDPVDEAQREQIRAILSEQNERFIELRLYTAQKHLEFMDSTRQALSEVLTAEQQARLRKWAEEDRLRGRRRGMGPPPFERMEEWRKWRESGGPPPFERRRRRGMQPPPADSLAEL